MIFFSDNPEKTGPKVEAKLRKEVPGAASLRYDVVVEGTFRPGSMGQFVGDLANSVMADFLVGGTRPLHTLRFEIAGVRPVEVKVNIIKARAVCVGSILFSAVLRKPALGNVMLEGEKVFSKSKFIGEPALAAKLNASAPLIKKLNGFARDAYVIGNSETIRSKRFADLRPIDQTSSLLSVGTMPRATWFGFGSTFDTAEFVAIADLIEASL